MIHDQSLPPLDLGFQPSILADREFRSAVAQDAERIPIAIAVQRADGSVSRIDAHVFGSSSPESSRNLAFAGRIVKSLLWQRGGRRLILAGPETLTSRLQSIYSRDGDRRFDAGIMERIYNAPMITEAVPLDRVPESREHSLKLGGHLDGCRIGFDLGASDWKIAAVIDGQTVFSQETPWDPSIQTDPDYHYQILAEGLKLAAEHLPRVDAIGGSAAGVYVENRVRVASLFRSIPESEWEQVESLFLRLQQEWNVPLAIANDGDVAALGGALSLGASSLLGLALGSSEACGYIDARGCLTGWLNELAFVPIDLQAGGPLDDWSGDRGCGAQYLSQQGVIRLAEKAGLPLDAEASLAERLVHVQEAMQQADSRAVDVFRSIGRYLAYALAQYNEIYDIENVIIMGRVTSGEGGCLLLDEARSLLKSQFSEIADRIDVRLPDEASRRVGQAVAAASLPEIRRNG